MTNEGTNQLRKNSLGLIAVTFMVISAAAPLTGVAGAMPLAFLLGNGTGIPLTFILLTLVMLAFAAGATANPLGRPTTNHASSDSSRARNSLRRACCTQPISRAPQGKGSSGR